MLQTTSLKDFIRESEAVVRKYSTESEMMLHINPLLEKLLASKSVPSEALKPRKDRFAMNLLHMPEDRIFSIIGGVWQPHQTTPIHDHLTWALIGVYAGQEREAIYRRIDDSSDPSHARLEKVSERTNIPGHVTVLGRAGIHKVDNPSHETTTSIHVRTRYRQYGKALLRSRNWRNWEVSLRLLQRSTRPGPVLAKSANLRSLRP